MTVGALLDLGLPLDALREAITALALPGVEVAVERVARSGIAAAKFHVRVHGEHPDQGAPTHGHGHRAWGEIRDLLTEGRLAAPVKERALAVFARLAEAEGRVHGVPADAVQFHEVGALDAIVDVVGAARPSTPGRCPWGRAACPRRTVRCRCRSRPWSSCSPAVRSASRTARASWSRRPAPPSSRPSRGARPRPQRASRPSATVPA